MARRLTHDHYFLEIARIVARRSTCRRNNVGCVAIDERNHIIATGYNGVARGARHCIDFPCAGSRSASGTALDLCEAIHAEANALLSCDTNAIAQLYCTHSPCVFCARLIANTTCRRIVFLQPYPHREAIEYLERNAITCTHESLP